MFRYQDSNLDNKDQNLAGCQLPNTGVSVNYPGDLARTLAGAASKIPSTSRRR